MPRANILRAIGRAERVSKASRTDDSISLSRSQRIASASCTSALPRLPGSRFALEMFHRRRNTTSARSRHPDVLLVIVDDLRPDLGAFGNKNAQTPHIDALAASAVTFTAAFAAVANCAPSRASFLTGLRPDATGVLDLKTHVRDVDPLVVTLPQRFRRAGYLAVSYGKVFHQDLDDAASWSPQAEADNETWAGCAATRGGAPAASASAGGQPVHDAAVPARGGRAQPAECTRGVPRGPPAPAACTRACRRLSAGPRPTARATPTRCSRRANPRAAPPARSRGPTSPSASSAPTCRNAPARYFDAALARAAARARARRRVGADGGARAPGRGRALRVWRRPARAAALGARDEAAPRLRSVRLVRRSQVGRVLDALRVPPDAARGGSAWAAAVAAGDATIALLGDHGWKLGHAGSWEAPPAADTRPALIRALGVAPRRRHARRAAGFVPDAGAARPPADMAATSADGGAPPPPPRLHGRSLYPLMPRRRAPRRGADERRLLAVAV